MSREHVDTGSVTGISWTPDCTQLAAVSASGTVVYGQVLGRKVEWQNIEVVLKETNKIIVHDILTEMEEDLDFRWATDGGPAAIGAAREARVPGGSAV